MVIKMDKNDLRLSTANWEGKKQKEGWTTFRDINKYGGEFPEDILLDWMSEMFSKEFTGDNIVEGSYDSISSGRRSITSLQLYGKVSSIFQCEIYIGKKHIAMAYKSKEGD